MKFVFRAFLTGTRLLTVASYQTNKKQLVAKCFMPVMAVGLAVKAEAQNAQGDDDCKDYMAAPITHSTSLKKSKDEMRTKMEILVMEIQKEFCDALETLENSDTKFKVDRYLKPKDCGGGITCVMEDGRVFERAGVSVSITRGHLSPALVQQMRARGKDLDPDKKAPYIAASVSSVIHPRNPNVPTVHFNYRYFETVNSAGQKIGWFGGGTDLTPYILFESDCKLFHDVLKKACDKHDTKLYPEYKKQCDDYFYITHRKEHRGIGGIFFDDLESSDPESIYQFVKSCGKSVVPCYVPIVKARKDTGYSYADREWQLLRRGRYAEFNMIYDRGTKFGLHAPNARIESVFMSMPPYAKWEYCHEPREQDKELVNALHTPRDWLGTEIN